MSQGRVLVTGASGFVGRALVPALVADGRNVRVAVRHASAMFPVTVETVTLPDLAQPVDWRPLLDGVDCVLHLAGIAHAGRGIPEEVYDRVNRAATADLAAVAGAVGVRRLVFVSSIRAQTGPAADRVLTEADPALPTDAYGRSKLAAEEAIRASGVPYTILRPVLIYGPGVKGNLATLLRLAALPLPLPFGAFTSRRSLLGLDNLITAVRLALDAPETARETYVVADPEPVSMVDILTAMRAARGRSPGLVSVPPGAFAVALKALGRADVWNRLGGSLIVDPAKLIAAGWSPRMETRAGLAAMAKAAATASK